LFEKPLQLHAKSLLHLFLLCHSCNLR